MSKKHEQKHEQKQAEKETMKKSSKGLPRVTDKVLAMDESGQQTWLTSKCSHLTDEQRKEVEARLIKAKTGNRKSKKFDFATIFKGYSVEELINIQNVLNDAMVVVAAREEKEAEEKLAQIKARIANCKSVKTTTTENAEDNADVKV